MDGLLKKIASIILQSTVATKVLIILDKRNKRNKNDNDNDNDFSNENNSENNPNNSENDSSTEGDIEVVLEAFADPKQIRLYPGKELSPSPSLSPSALLWVG